MPDCAVFDSSAVLALLQGEEGSAIVAPLVYGALLSAVYLCEVHSKLIQRGFPVAWSWNRIAGLKCDVCAFTSEQARAAAELIPLTQPFGLSLGDRACLSLAIERHATVYTTDRAWKNLSLAIEIEVIR